MSCKGQQLKTISKAAIDQDQFTKVQDVSLDFQQRPVSILQRLKSTSLPSVIIVLLVFLLRKRPVPTFTYELGAVQATSGDHLPSPSHIDGTPTFAYPTLGVPEPGKTFNNTPVGRDGFIAFDSEINKLMKPYNDTDCEFIKYGEKEDGSYLVCKNYLERSQAFINLGINGIDGLGCDLTTNYPMPNYQYDCTNPSAPICETNREANVFNYACVGETTEKTKNHTFYTLEDILRRHNLINKHITLKMDCQGGQIPGLKYFPTEYLDYVDQILMQYHFTSQRWVISPQIWGTLDIFRTLSQKFVNVNYHTPWWLCFSQKEQEYRRLPGFAVELTLINKKVIKMKSPSRSYALHPLNFKACQPPK